MYCSASSHARHDRSRDRLCLAPAGGRRGVLRLLLHHLRLTPYDEFKLIREGNIAAALSLAGALLGFVLTIASSITHADGLVPFLFWAVMASVVQLIVFLVLTRLMPDYRLQIEHNNIAAGMLFGVSALAVGVINAACLS